MRIRPKKSRNTLRMGSQGKGSPRVFAVRNLAMSFLCYSVSTNKCHPHQEDAGITEPQNKQNQFLLNEDSMQVYLHYQIKILKDFYIPFLSLLQ